MSITYSRMRTHMLPYFEALPVSAYIGIGICIYRYLYISVSAVP